MGDDDLELGGGGEWFERRGAAGFEAQTIGVEGTEFELDVFTGTVTLGLFDGIERGDEGDVKVGLFEADGEMDAKSPGDDCGFRGIAPGEIGDEVGVEVVF